MITNFVGEVAISSTQTQQELGAATSSQHKTTTSGGERGFLPLAARQVSEHYSRPVVACCREGICKQYCAAVPTAHQPKALCNEGYNGANGA